MSRLFLNQTERSGIPESSGSAQGQDNLVALGKLEQLTQPLANGAHHVLHCRLAVGGAHDAWVALTDVGDLGVPDL